VTRTATEPPPTPWEFPPLDAGDDSDLIGIGADLEPGTLLAAYRAGIFPMPLRRGVLGWWSPEPRAILPIDGLHASRRLQRSLRRFEVRVDTAFGEVIDACGDPLRPHGWITRPMRDAYVRLHQLGWVHCVEAWSRDDGSLAGGLYGVVIGGLFAGESMFHRTTDASKVALTGLIDILGEAEGSPGAAAAAGRLLDVQWLTPHLSGLGAVEVPRAEYLQRLARALRLPPPPRFGAV